MPHSHKNVIPTPPPETMGNKILLITVSINLLLQLAGILITSLLLIVSYKMGYWSRKGLFLINAMIHTEILFFVLGMPFMLNFMVYYDEHDIEVPPLNSMITAIPITMHNKTSLVFMIGIAADRLAALLLPFYYQRLNHKFKAITVTLFAYLIGAIDVLSSMFLCKTWNYANCTAFGCFTCSKYLEVTMRGNGVLGIIQILISIAYIVKLRFYMKKDFIEKNDDLHNSFSQANQMAVISILSTGAFNTIPMTVVGLFVDLNTMVFKIIGPFLLTFLLIGGVLDSSTLLLMNREYFNSLKKILPFCKKTRVKPLIL